MPRAPRTRNETPSRADVLRRREALGAHLEAWRGRMGSDVATWPDELRCEYVRLSQEWFRLGMLAEDLGGAPPSAR